VDDAEKARFAEHIRQYILDGIVRPPDFTRHLYCAKCGKPLTLVLRRDDSLPSLLDTRSYCCPWCGAKNLVETHGSPIKTERGHDGLDMPDYPAGQCKHEPIDLTRAP
jgi:hypothetical protein